MFLVDHNCCWLSNDWGRGAWRTGAARRSDPAVQGSQGLSARLDKALTPSIVSQKLQAVPIEDIKSLTYHHSALSGRMFSARKKIAKEKGAEPDEFEEQVAQVPHVLHAKETPCLLV